MDAKNITMKRAAGAVLVAAALALGATAVVKTGYFASLSRGLSMLSQSEGTGAQGGYSHGAANGNASAPARDQGGSAQGSGGQYGAAHGSGGTSSGSLDKVEWYAAILVGVAVLTWLLSLSAKAIRRRSASPRRPSASAP